jgi:hypothetical protein
VDRGGRIDGLGDRPLLPPIDLFSKPAAGGNGAGAARWLREADGSYRAEDGARMTPDHLLTALRESAGRGPILVQPLVRNHDELREIVGDTLSTVRFVSVLTRSGSWEPILAIHRLAERDSDEVHPNCPRRGIDTSTASIRSAVPARREDIGMVYGEEFGPLAVAIRKHAEEHKLEWRKGASDEDLLRDGCVSGVADRLDGRAIRNTQRLRST